MKTQKHYTSLSKERAELKKEFNKQSIETDWERYVNRAEAKYQLSKENKNYSKANKTWEDTFM